MMNDMFETDPATGIVITVSLVSWPGESGSDFTNLELIVDSDESDDVSMMYTDNNGKRHDMGVYSLMALKSAVDRLAFEV
jgi:hypothetical protein